MSVLIKVKSPTTCEMLIPTLEPSTVDTEKLLANTTLMKKLASHKTIVQDSQKADESCPGAKIYKALVRYNRSVTVTGDHYIVANDTEAHNVMTSGWSRHI